MLGADIRVIPVQVRLLRCEEVQIPVARSAVGVRRPAPRFALELRPPAGRRLVTVLATTRAEPEALTLRRTGSGRERGLEPWVAIRDVVGDDIDDRPDAQGEGVGDQALGLDEG